MKSIENRNKTYKNIVNRIPAKRKRIYEIIVLHTQGITAHQISERYNIPINQITGRITELKEMCFIKEDQLQFNHITGNHCTSYKAITDNNEFLVLTNNKYIELMDKQTALISDHLHSFSKYTDDFIRKELAKIEKKIKQIDETQKLAA
tara:strand:- start:1872 stop:2318 length:447 start_codon:yes stop_codon:yes gene_type:complete